MFKLKMPSPAMVIACLALFVAMGGTGYAATQLATGEGQAIASKGKKVKRGPRGPIGPAGPQGPIGPQGPKGDKGDPGTPATKLWAVLDGTGGLVRGSGAVSSGHPGEGRETVVFNQDVSNCAYLATPGTTGGSTGSGSFPTQGEAAVGPLLNNNNGVVVTRANASGVLVDFPVYVAVFC